MSVDFFLRTASWEQTSNTSSVGRLGRTSLGCSLLPSTDCQCDTLARANLVQAIAHSLAKAAAEVADGATDAADATSQAVAELRDASQECIAHAPDAIADGVPDIAQAVSTARDVVHAVAARDAEAGKAITDRVGDAADCAAACAEDGCNAIRAAPIQCAALGSYAEPAGRDGGPAGTGGLEKPKR